MLGLMMRWCALGYPAILCAAAIWAWGSEVAYYGSEQEHLLPPIVLFLASLPTSLSIIVICGEASGYCGQYGQLALVTSCGAAQAGALLLVSRRAKPAGSEKPSEPR